jgi:EamA domain-containing membrane protein RarD
LLSALSFGVFDVLTQLWSNLPGSSFGRVLPWSIMFAAVITAVVIVALDRRPNRSDVPRERTRFFAGIPRGARLYLALGVGLLALQSLILIASIGYFNDAAGLNVAYSSRGVWSVLVVWLVGHWFSAHERIHAGALLARRLIAASLIAAAVALVFF